LEMKFFRVPPRLSGAPNELGGQGGKAGGEWGEEYLGS